MRIKTTKKTVICFAKETNRGFGCVRSSFSKEIAFRFKNMHRGWCGQGVARIKFYADCPGSEKKGRPASVADLS